MVGFWPALQQTPRAVIVAPPPSVTTPPDEAVIAVILFTDNTETVGAVLMVSFLQLKIKITSSKERNNAKKTFIIFMAVDLVLIISNLTI
jgi:hypothetical protein